MAVSIDIDERKYVWQEVLCSTSFRWCLVCEIPRSVFNRSHGYKTTLDAGLLVPFLVDEVLPGDSISLNATLFGRLAPDCADYG